MARAAWRPLLVALPVVVVALPATVAARSAPGVASAKPATTAASPRPHAAPTSPRRPFSPKIPHPLPRTQTLPVTLVATSTHELAVDKLPVIMLDPPPPGASPPPLPAADAQHEPGDIRLIDEAAAAAAASPAPTANRGDVSDPWRASSRGGVTVARTVRIESTSGGVMEIGWERGSMTSATLGARCDPVRSGARPVPPRALQWRQLRRRDDGSFVLREGNAWFDRSACKLIDGLHTEAALSAVASFDGQPLVLAARVGSGEIVLVTPPLSDVQQDSGGGPKVHPFAVEGGLLSFVRVKPVRGGSLTLSAGVHQASWQQWRRQLGDSLAAFGPLPATVVRLDLSQSVGEPAPLALLTVQRPVGTQERPVAATNATRDASFSHPMMSDPF